jgi:hypothetical protein
MKNTEDTQRIFGYHLPKPRITGVGLVLCALYLGVPVVMVGALLDFALQLAFGWCVGVWCAF